VRGLGDWNGFLPAEALHELVTRTQAKSCAFFTPDAQLFCVQGEYDDGNGMWLITGVSPCGQKNSVVTIPCPCKSNGLNTRRIDHG